MKCFDSLKKKNRTRSNNCFMFVVRVCVLRFIFYTGFELKFAIYGHLITWLIDISVCVGAKIEVCMHSIDFRSKIVNFGLVYIDIFKSVSQNDN